MSSFNIVIEKIITLQEELIDNGDGDLLDRSWTVDQVELIVDALQGLDDNQDGLDPFNINMLLSTSKKEKKETETVSDILAKVLIKEIKYGEGISHTLERQIGPWLQDIQMIDSDIRLELILAMLNNPGKVPIKIRQEALLSLGLYGSALPQELEQSFDNNPEDAGKLLKIIEILNQIILYGNYTGFEEAAEEAERILNRIGAETNIYFIKKRIEQLTGSIFERVDIKNIYGEDNLSQEYNIKPLERKFVYHKNSFDQECLYSRISPDYAVIYNPEGEIDSFFKLDLSREEKIRDEALEFGRISQQDLEIFINKFRNALASDNFEDMLYYFQIRKLLPSQLSKEIEEKIGIIIPEDLDKEFNSREEFNREIGESKDDILSQLKESSVDNLQFLVEELEGLLQKRGENNKIKYHGFSSDNTNLLDFFNSFIHQLAERFPGESHNSICYYLYLRKYLPAELVTDFEEKFNLKVSKKLSYFETFDDYMKVDSAELLLPFYEAGDLEEMSSWLESRIQKLSNSIQEDKQETQQKTLAEILEAEGLEKERLSKPEDFEKTLDTYRALMIPALRKMIEVDFNIKLATLDIRTQLQFINFISVNSQQEVMVVADFTHKFGENGFKTFLACEYGLELGDKIINLGEKLEPQTAKVIFAKYLEIIDQTDEVIDYLQQEFGHDKNFNEETIKSIKENLFRRGKDLLLDFSLQVDRQNGDINETEIITKLEEVKTDVILFASTFRAVTETGEIDFADMANTKLETKTTKELMPGEIEEMIRIFQDNRRDYPPQLEAVVVNDFIKALDSAESVFHTLKYNNKIVSFIRFDELAENKVYAGSFNVRPEGRGANIGTVMMQTVLDRYAKTNTLEAVVYSKNPMLNKYLKDFGFKIVGVEENYLDSGELFYKIARANKPVSELAEVA